MGPSKKRSKRSTATTEQEGVELAAEAVTEGSSHRRSVRLSGKVKVSYTEASDYELIDEIVGGEDNETNRDNIEATAKLMDIVGESEETNVERGANDAALPTTNYAKLDLFDLPMDLVSKILNNAGSLLCAELVCKRWYKAIESNCVLWRNVMERLGYHVDQSLVNELLNSEGTEEYARVSVAISKKCRQEIMTRRKCICVVCFNAQYSNIRKHPVWNIRLCRDCENIDKYKQLSLTQARKYFKLSTKKVQNVIVRGELDTYSYTSRNYYNTVVTLYKFQQLVDLAKRAFGEEKAAELEAKARKKLGIRK